MTATVSPAAGRNAGSLWLLAVLGAVGVSSVWFDYPLVLGERPIRILLFRELVVILGIVGIWAIALRRFAAEWRAGAGSTPAVAPASRGRLASWMVAAGVVLAYAPTVRLDIESHPTFALYVKVLSARPWRMFLPGHLWQVVWVDGAYRPLGLMFTGFVALASPSLLIASGVLLHALNVLLIVRVSLLLWPGRVGLAVLAGLLAGVWPQVIGTVIDPLNHPYLLFTALYLSAIVLFELGLRRERWTPVLLSTICLVAAVLTMEFAVTLPVAIALFGVATGSLVKARRLAVRALALQFLVAAAYVTAYVGYVAYARSAGVLTKAGLLFPLNPKRILLSVTYLPFWAFLFPLEEISIQHVMANLTWLLPVLAMPLVWIAMLEPWKDRGFCFGVMAASLAVLPAANFFEMVTWGNERYGYLAFLWLCLPYSWLLAQSTKRPWRHAWGQPIAVTASLAVVLTVGILSSQQFQTFIHIGSVAKNMTAALASAIPPIDAGAQIDVVNLDRLEGYLSPARAQLFARFPGASLRLRTATYETRESTHLGIRRVDIHWEDTAMTSVGTEGRDSAGRPERVFYWAADRDRYLELTQDVRRRLQDTERAPIRVVAVRPALGLVPFADGSWLQRHRSGQFDVLIERKVPGLHDELVLRMAVIPLGFQPTPIANEGALEWAFPDAGDGRSRTFFPILADGVDTEYRIRLGTRASWLAAEAVERLSISLPEYPLRIRVQ